MFSVTFNPKKEFLFALSIVIFHLRFFTLFFIILIVAILFLVCKLQIYYSGNEFFFKCLFFLTDAVTVIRIISGVAG